MQRLLIALAALLFSIPALADSLVHNLGTNTTSPFPAGSCIYVDQGPGTDTKLCSGWAAAIGALVAANNLSDLTNTTTSQNNLFGTPTQNKVYASPNGSTGNPTFRALVGADIPVPSASTLGGTESITCGANQHISQINTSGVPICTTDAGASAAPGGATNAVQYNAGASTFGGIAALTNGQLVIGSTGAAPTAGSVGATTPNISWTTGGGTLSLGTTIPLNTQNGNSAYTIVAGDNTKAVTRTNTVTQSDAIPQAGGSFPSGFAFGYSTATVGNTLTTTTSTINGIAGGTGIKVGSQEEIACNSDGTNWNCLLGVPQPSTQTGTTVLIDNMTWADFNGTGTSGHKLPYLDGTNTWSGTQTFGTVVGSINTQSGTTYTLAASDCGKTILFTSNSAITLTTLNSLAAGCSIAVEQGGTGQVTLADGSGATHHSAHSFTKTFGQYAIIGLFVDTNSGGSAADFIITGDGA